MRILLFTLFYLPVVAGAQDCKLKSDTDPFTHETKVSTGFMPFDKGSIKMSVSMDATPGLVDFFLWLKTGNRCFDDKSYAEVIFEGEKSKMRLKNTGSMNCEGAFHFSFKNGSMTNSQLKKIASKPISSINLVGTSKEEIFISLTNEQKDHFMAAAACITNAAEKLAKK